jgi:hypothetical protein
MVVVPSSKMLLRVLCALKSSTQRALRISVISVLSLFFGHRDHGDEVKRGTFADLAITVIPIPQSRERNLAPRFLVASRHSGPDSSLRSE